MFNVVLLYVKDGWDTPCHMPNVVASSALDAPAVARKCICAEWDIPNNDPAAFKTMYVGPMIPGASGLL